jgi:hypothetical protein
MIPQNWIVAVARDASRADVLRLLLEEGHSQIPVYDGTIDNVVGHITIRGKRTSGGPRRVPWRTSPVGAGVTFGSIRSGLTGSKSRHGEAPRRRQEHEVARLKRESTVAVDRETTAALQHGAEALERRTSSSGRSRPARWPSKDSPRRWR